MATGDRIRVSVIEGYYVSLQEAGLPLSVCIQLQECKLSLEQAQWTAKQTNLGFSVSLFWPDQQSSDRGVKQPVRVSKKRRKPRRRTKATPSCPPSSVQLPGSSAQVQSSRPPPATLDDAHPPCVTTTPCILKRAGNS